MRRKFTQSARKHRISKGRAEYVMSTATPVTQEAGPDLILCWIGEDDRGLELGVLGKITADLNTGERILLIMHVMPTALRRN